jgi:hypothetical protein
VAPLPLVDMLPVDVPVPLAPEALFVDCVVAPSSSSTVVEPPHEAAATDDTKTKAAARPMRRVVSGAMRLASCPSIDASQNGQRLSSARR